MSFIKKALVRGLSQRILAVPGKRFVFVYHEISTPEASKYSDLYSTPDGIFREHVELLEKHFSLVSLEEILSPCSSGKRERLAAITFDDGFLSVKEAAFPYLSAKGIPFSIFVNRQALTENRLLNGFEGKVLESGKKLFLDEADLKFLSQNDVAVGSHSATHRSLLNCDEASLSREIDDNKIYLEQLIGKPVRHLALPFGKREHYNQRVLDHCKQAGHEYVFSSNPACFDLQSPSYLRRLIPRIGLTNETPGELIFKINRPIFKTVDI